MASLSKAAVPLDAPLILFADDNSDDRRLMQLALDRIGAPCQLQTVPDGQALMDALRGGSRPSLILLDLNMPILGGMEALQQIKADPRLRHLPVVIWSTSESPSEILQSYQLGSNSFFKKPEAFDKLVETVKLMVHYWLRAANLPPAMA
jgi:CheY-like chemotaxis protein